MRVITQSEEKEALRTRPGYSFEAYASMAARAMNLNTHEATDRRIVFELTGYKLSKEGVFVEEDDEVSYDKKVDPSTTNNTKT